MTANQNNALDQIQGEVFTLIGRSILNLQSLELRLKTLIPHFERSTTDPTGTRQQERLSKSTLGGLVTLFIEKGFDQGGDAENTPPKIKEFELLLRMRVCLEDEKLRALSNSLAELVFKRNFLTHHFQSEYSLREIEDCKKAITYLEQLNEQARAAHGQLDEVVEQLNAGKAVWAELMASEQKEEILDWIFGPDTR